MRQKKKACILLVDDNPANLITLNAVLDLPRYELVEATTGFEAVRLCTEREFALIVLDVQMPGMDGFETAKRIKGGGKNQSVPIIFVTAVYHADPFVKKGFDAGAIDYFGKPFDPEILKAKVSIYADLYLKTKRLEETEDLLKTHAQIKALLEAMPVGVIIADSEGHIYESNEEAQRIWAGSRQVDIAQYDQYKGWWPKSGKQIQSHEWAMARALERGQSSKDELIEIESFDGQKKLIINSAFPIRANDGQIRGAVVVLQDITTRRAIADDMERKYLQIFGDAKDHTHSS